MASSIKVFLKVRSSRPELFCKKGVHRNVAKLTVKELCHSLFFIIASGAYCEFSEISKNTFYYRIHPAAASKKC